MASWPWGLGSTHGAKLWESARSCWMKVPSAMVSLSLGPSTRGWAGLGSRCPWEEGVGIAVYTLNFLSSRMPGPLPSQTRLDLPGPRYPVLPFPGAGAGACRSP